MIEILINKPVKLTVEKNGAVKINGTFRFGEAKKKPKGIRVRKKI